MVGAKQSSKKKQSSRQSSTSAKYLSVNGKRKRGHVIRREKAREPQLIETSKRCLLVRGRKSGEHGLEVLRDLKKVRVPDDTILFSRKNDLTPFEDETGIEFLCQKNDAGLFAFSSHNKKRPNNLILGRLFDGHLLDLVEFGIEEFTSFQEMIKKTKVAKAVGGQTCVIFQGNEFEKDLNMQTVKSVLLDMFRPQRKEIVDLTSMDHLVVCTAAQDRIYVRNYSLVFKAKSETKKAEAVEVNGMKIPNITLVDMGPSMDLKLRRTRLATTELMKMALRQPKKSGLAKKVKNISHDELLGKMGRIHMEKQNTNELVTRSRFKKALKR